MFQFSKHLISYAYAATNIYLFGAMSSLLFAVLDREWFAFMGYPVAVVFVVLALSVRCGLCDALVYRRTFKVHGMPHIGFLLDFRACPACKMARMQPR